MLFDLLTGLSGAEESGKVDTFSHYLISETNLLFDRLCRIRATVERERPAKLVIGAGAATGLANDLYAAASGIRWPAELRLQRWDLESPLARLDDR